MEKPITPIQPAFPFYKGAPERAKQKVKKNGYAATPGTGPDGETCKTCDHKTYHETAKRYYKCDLVNWSHGKGTDVLLRSPACLRWEPET